MRRTSGTYKNHSNRFRCITRESLISTAHLIILSVFRKWKQKKMNFLRMIYVEYKHFHAHTHLPKRTEMKFQKHLKTDYVRCIYRNVKNCFTFCVKNLSACVLCYSILFVLFFGLFMFHLMNKVNTVKLRKQNISIYN